MEARPYQVCTRCVMDVSDSAIKFDADGVCDHCKTFDREVAPNWSTGPEGQKRLEKDISAIKEAGKNKDFDCIIGVSGGIDSSYLAWCAKRKWGLRPLIFHVDGGWNSQEAVNNIEQLVDNPMRFVYPWLIKRCETFSFLFQIRFTLTLLRTTRFSQPCTNLHMPTESNIY